MNYMKKIINFVKWLVINKFKIKIKACNVHSNYITDSTILILLCIYKRIDKNFITDTNFSKEDKETKT